MAAQRERAAIAAHALAPLASTHRLVITHGSGPQIGVLAEQAAAASTLRDITLDVLDAQVEGMIGYLLMQAFAGVVDAQVVTVLTQVVVRQDDPAFASPTKPIGPFVDAETAARLRTSFGWTFVEQDGRYRRVVASPEPMQVIELEALRALVNANFVPICAGGGGIPVMRSDAKLVGVEAVVDKDAITATIAIGLDADLMLLLTDVEGLMTGWGTDHPTLVRRSDPATARAMLLESGSMGPKVKACADFTSATGRPSYIGRLADAIAVVAGRHGTMITPSGR
jgi:carbamate kinase